MDIKFNIWNKIVIIVNTIISIGLLLLILKYN